MKPFGSLPGFDSMQQSAPSDPAKDHDVQSDEHRIEPETENTRKRRGRPRKTEVVQAPAKEAEVKSESESESESARTDLAKKIPGKYLKHLKGETHGN